MSRKSVSFNQLDARSGARIRMKKVSSVDGTDVPDDQIVKGYEISKDHYVVVEPEELDQLDPVATRSIDLEDFVELTEIDPLFYDSPYYLAPDRGAAKPYALLARAMEESGKVGIARFVMRSKQYLAAIRVSEGHLVLSTMVYADEVVDPAAVDGLDEAAGVELSERELAMAQQLIESLAADFEPEKYHDTHRQQVLELIERKAAGEDITAPVAAPEPAKVVDLMAALEASVREAKAARGRHPTGIAGEDAAAADAAEEPAAATKAPARKRKSA